MLFTSAEKLPVGLGGDRSRRVASQVPDIRVRPAHALRAQHDWVASGPQVRHRRH